MSAASSRHRHLRLVVGTPEPGPAGIQDAFIEEVRRLKERDPLRPITILVGSNYLRLHLSRLLAVSMGGHANLSFLLLGDLARQIGAASLAARGRRELPDLGQDLLLRETVAALSQGGSYFSEIVAHEGFIEALGATLRDLKDARIDPGALRAATAAGAVGSSRGGDPVSGKLNDLADLYEAYDDLLRDRRFHDDEDLMRSAADEAASAGLVSRDGAPGSDAPAVLVYGFYDATWNQRLLIREYLAFKIGAIFVPCEPSDPERTWDYALPMLEWLASWVPERIDLSAAARAGRREASPGPDIGFLSAPGEAREAVEAIRWLVSQARERSIPFGEMGLLYRSPDPYRGVVAEVMEQAGAVPHFMADGRPLSATPVARALHLVLKIREEGFSRRSVIDFLGVAHGDGRASRWDRLSREAGVVSGIVDWRDRLDRLDARLGSGDVGHGHVTELRRRVEDLHTALRAVPVEGTWVALADACADLLRRFAPDDPSGEKVEACLSKLGALDDISSPVTFERFAATLSQALDRASYRAAGEEAFQRSGIFVGTVMDARLLSFHVTAIMGLVERSFPAPARQDPILLDDERGAINALLGEPRLSLKMRRLEEERLLFRLARATAADRILVSYPRLDPATARPRIASPYLLRLARTLEGRHVDYEALERLDRMKRVSLAALAPADSRSALFPREFILRAIESASSPGADADSRRRVATFLHANPILHRALAAEAARWGESRFTSHDGVILRPSLLESLRAVHPKADAPVSASRIEAYAGCPLAYFMKHVLHLEALDEPEEMERLDPLRRGALVHRILFEIYTALRDRGALPLGAGRIAEALALQAEICARLFARIEAEGITGYRLLWEIDKEKIRTDLADLLRLEASGDGEGWVPAHFELRYGMQRRPDMAQGAEDPASTAEPVVVEIAPGRAVRIKGQIDRVDISPDGRQARIIDYKTGKMDRYKPDMLRGGTTVQLPLYMLASGKLLASRQSAPEVTEARYLSVEGRTGFKTVSFSAGALNERREALSRVLATFTSGVERGVFFAYPEADICRYCDYRLACGEGREARFARKRGDQTAADFLKMREEIE
jgi:RecB family exonuclease